MSGQTICCLCHDGPGRPPSGVPHAALVPPTPNPAQNCHLRPPHSQRTTIPPGSAETKKDAGGRNAWHSFPWFNAFVRGPIRSSFLAAGLAIALSSSEEREKEAARRQQGEETKRP